MSERIPMDEFEYYLTDLLEKEAMNAEETLDEILSRRAIQLKGKLNLRSPKDTGEYSRGWKVRTATRNHERVKVIYNAARPELTYILEYGNAHQRAKPHIRPALDEEIDEIMEELINRL